MDRISKGTFINTYEKGRVERGLLHDPPAKLINKCCIREWEAGSCPGRRCTPMMEHMLRPLVGKERSQWRTQKSNDFDLFVPFCHRSLLGRLVSHPKASRKVQHIFIYDQRSHCCYALHRVRVFLLSFLHFSTMRFASLYRRERPLGLIE